MSNYEKKKPNYNESKHNNEYYANRASSDRQMEPKYPPLPYYNESRDTIYQDNEVNGKDFIIGALVGGIVGALTALLLAPKSGTELRGDISTQAVHLREKTVDLSSTAKEKTTQLSKQLQEQSGQIVDKVKSIKAKPTSPLDDGTASSEGEEPIDYMETISHTTAELTSEQEDDETAVSEALKEAVIEAGEGNKSNS